MLQGQYRAVSSCLSSSDFYFYFYFFSGVLRMLRGYYMYVACFYALLINPKPSLLLPRLPMRNVLLMGSSMTSCINTESYMNFLMFSPIQK
jgi:hypothetical protein